jgi:hypothetical protein
MRGTRPGRTGGRDRDQDAVEGVADGKGGESVAAAVPMAACRRKGSGGTWTRHSRAQAMRVLLFVRAAELTVMTGPMVQVGWGQGLSGRHRPALVAPAAAERAAKGRERQMPNGTYRAGE